MTTRRHAWEELRARMKERNTESFEHPETEFGQIWHVSSSIYTWLAPGAPRPVLFPVVVVEPGMRIGTLSACRVFCMHELSASACADDLLDDTGITASRDSRPAVLAPRLDKTIFPGMLDRCAGAVSDRMRRRMRYFLEHPDEPIAADWRGSADPDDLQVADDRQFLDRQTALYNLPADRYRAVWRRIGETLAALDLAEAEAAIHLRRAIDELTTAATLSPGLVEDARVAGGATLLFNAITADQVRTEIARIDTAFGKGTPEARRGTISFAHKCFEDTLDPAILSILENLLDEHHRERNGGH